MPQPVLQKTKLHCAECGKDVELKLLLNVEISVWITFMKKLRCPLCGAGFKKLRI